LLKPDNAEDCEHTFGDFNEKNRS